jgi:hypothetical protein
MYNVFVTGPTGVRYHKSFTSQERAAWFVERALDAGCRVWSDLPGSAHRPS